MVEGSPSPWSEPYECEYWDFYPLPLIINTLIILHDQLLTHVDTFNHNFY